MKTKLTLILFFLLAIAACKESPKPADNGSVDAPAAVVDVDVATLPTTIDVNMAASLQNRDDVVLIDVREQWEYDEGHIPGVILIPMSELQSRVSEIPKDKEVVLTCRSGNRSGQVFNFLQESGYDNLHNMEGGIVAWEAAGLEVEH